MASPPRLRRVRIFVASPGDVLGERDQLGEVVDELNQILSALVPEAGLVLELVRWETHVHPGLGSRPQQIVNQQVEIGEYDVFVGIFWQRFGTPTAVADSGTEEEFQAAYRAWKELGRAIQIMVYFCRALAPPPEDTEAARQLQKVVEFRQELLNEGLVRDYGEHANFAASVRRDLILVLGQLLHSDTRPAEIAAKAAERTASSEQEGALEKIRVLAGEYDALRDPIRGLPSGSERTRRMEVVASEMRALALSAYPFLPQLIGSGSAGERLAAVSTLVAIPDERHLRWLAERLATEKPFIGYHAALALLAAARQLDDDQLPQVESALDLAQTTSRRLREDTDRQTTLRHASDELARRRATARDVGRSLPREQA
jgi:hypothetical protein